MEEKIIVKCTLMEDEDIIFTKEDYKFIRFFFNNENYIDISLKDEGIDINASHRINIEPNASNSIHITVEDIFKR